MFINNTVKIGDNWFVVKPYVLIKKIPSGKFLVYPRLGGVRCVAIPEEGNYFLFSEEGKKLIFPRITEVLDKYFGNTGLVFDGEITTVDLNNQESLKYNIFDSIYSEELITDIAVKEPLYKRYNRLLDVLSLIRSDFISMAYHVLLEDKKDILDFYKYCLEEGFESIILKKFYSLYDKENTWFEKKPTKVFNLSIVSCNEGVGRKSGVLGSFSVNFNGLIEKVSGMKYYQRKEFWKNREKLLGKKIVVEAEDVKKDGSLMFPRFKCFVSGDSDYGHK